MKDQRGVRPGSTKKRESWPTVARNKPFAHAPLSDSTTKDDAGLWTTKGERLQDTSSSSSSHFRPAIFLLGRFQLPAFQRTGVSVFTPECVPAQSPKRRRWRRKEEDCAWRAHTHRPTEQQRCRSTGCGACTRRRVVRKREKANDRRVGLSLFLALYVRLCVVGVVEVDEGGGEGQSSTRMSVSTPMGGQMKEELHRAGSFQV